MNISAPEKQKSFSLNTQQAINSTYSALTKLPARSGVPSMLLKRYITDRCLTTDNLEI